MFQVLTDADGVVRDERGVRIAPNSVRGLTAEYLRRFAPVPPQSPEDVMDDATRTREREMDAWDPEVRAYAIREG